VHEAAAVERWVQRHSSRIRVFPLPTYSPELNADECLNQDVKSKALEWQRPHDKQEMVQDLRSYLRSTQRQPDVVKSYFRRRCVRYAQT